MGWGSFLLAIAGPVAKRVLVALGLSVVTFAGVSAAVSGLLSHAKAAWAGAGFVAGVPDLIAMAGLNTALSIIAGAIIGRVALLTLKKIIPT